MPVPETPEAEPEQEESGKQSAHSKHYVREDSEYVRLVIPNQPRLPPADARTKSLVWWTKAFVFCIFITILTLIFIKWGVPFLFEQVFSVLTFLLTPLHHYCLLFSPTNIKYNIIWVVWQLFVLSIHWHTSFMLSSISRLISDVFEMEHLLSSS